MISQDQYRQLFQLLQSNSIASTSSIIHSSSSLTNGAMQPKGTTFGFKHFAANVYKSSDIFQPHLSWRVDSGATNHICSNKSLFSSLSKISQTQFIGLPNGNDTIVSFVGNVPLHESLVLKNVLYAPSFKYNLVSIPKITSQYQIFGIFTDNNCLLQDPSV